MLIDRVLVCFSLMFLVLVCRANTDSLLQELNLVMENQSQYVAQKQQRIQQYKEMIRETMSVPARFQVYDSLWFEYSSFQFDSAFKYANEMLQVAERMEDSARMARAKLNLAFIFRSAGMYKEAYQTLARIDASLLPNDLAIRYYESMGRTYFDLSSFNGIDYFVESYGSLGNMYIDSAIHLADSESLASFRLRGLKAEASGNYREAMYLFHQIIEQFEVSQHQQAMAYYSLGKINQALGNNEAYRDMIVRAAIADVRSATKETVATMELAGYMYHHGATEAASRYIDQAARDAKFYGAKQRIIQVSSLLPLIESAMLLNAQDKSKKLLGYLVLVSFLSVLIIIFAFIIFRQNRKLNAAKSNLSQAYENLRELNEKLIEANTIKEEYVGFSFAKDSEYLHKLEKFKMDISKKLIEKRYDDLKYSLKQFDLESETERLNKKFDEIFLKLFPNFVSDFNSFFREEDKFKTEEKKPLPTELRIFALIRIGITEHEQIASILGYSVRTIYNYKNKVKKQSTLSSDEFDLQLMKIKTFE